MAEPAGEPAVLTPSYAPTSPDPSGNSGSGGKVTPIREESDEGHSLTESAGTPRVETEETLLADLPPEALNYRNQEVYQVRGLNKVLVVDHDYHECYMLKWKTFKKNQRKGRELDPRAFNEQERKAFSKSDAKEWASFLATGAVVIIPPKEAAKVDPDRIFKRTTINRGIK